MYDLKWVPFVVLFNREIQRFFKVSIQTVASPLIASALYLLIFGVSLGKNIDLGVQMPYLAFLIPGLVMMGCLNNAFANSSSSVVGSKYAGELEDYKVSPLSPNQILWALCFGGLFRGLLVSGITFLVGEAFYYVQMGEWLSVAHPVFLLFFLSVGGLSFAAFGMSVAFWAKSFDHMGAVGSFILQPLIYLGGVFYSVNNLPEFWQVISKFNPMLYLINGVRFGILGISDVSLGMSIFMSLAMLVVFYLVAFLILKNTNYKRW